MTIPLLTILQSEPARSQPAAAGNARSDQRRDTDRHRTDDRDFAAAMSDGAQDTRPEPVNSAQAADGQGRAEPARQSDPSAESTARAGDAQDVRGGTSDEGSPGLAAQDAPRRQVTIPDLPAKRGMAATADLQSPETIRGPQHAADADMAAEHPVLAAAEIDARAARHATPRPATDQTASDETAPLRAASGPLAGAGTSRAEAQATTGALTLSDPANASSGTEEPATTRLQATAEATRDDQRRGMAPPDARIAAAGNPVAQAVRANTLSRAASNPPAEDRMAGRTREPAARAPEAVAATPAPAPQTNAAQVPVAAQAAMLQLATRDATTAKDKAEALLSLDGESEGMRFDLRGTSGSTSTQQGSFASALTQTHLPRGIAMQLGDIMRAMPDRPVEVALSPEELGRVRLSISTSEGGVTLYVLAERPETLDLMRRHAEQLARELADLGFGSIDLFFGQGRDPDGGEDQTAGDAKVRNARAGDDTDTRVPAEGPVNRMTLSPSGGLDIRI